MRHFAKIADGIHVEPLLDQVMAHPELWNSDPDWMRAKQISGSVLYAGENIILRYVGVPPDQQDREALMMLPEARPIIFGLMRVLEGVRLGNVVISRVLPGGKIMPHVDAMPWINPLATHLGRAPAMYQRFQIPLQAGPKVVFGCGEEVLSMVPGEAWWFDNQQMHYVENNGPDDRISMFCDIRPSAAVIASSRQRGK